MGTTTEIISRVLTNESDIGVSVYDELGIAWLDEEDVGRGLSRFVSDLSTVIPSMLDYRSAVKTCLSRRVL